MSDLLDGQMVPGEPITIDGGWRVRETDDYYVDVLQMMFGNWRPGTLLW